MALPKSFSLVGNGLGVIGIVFSGIFNYYTMSLCNEMVDQKDKNSKVDYEKLALENVGPKGAKSVEISIFIM